MKTTSVDIQDFLAVGRATMRLDDRGLILVQGENRNKSWANSNGSGKSSMVDAICWALFGETARGVKAAQVIRKGTKGATVKVDLLDEDDGGKIYRITRGRTKGKGTLGVLRLDPDGSITEMTLGTEALTQAVVNKIVGCSYEVFRAAVYLGQEQMPDLPGMTDKKLKELIEEAAGVGILERAYEQARVRLLTATHTVNQTRLLADNAKSSVKRAQDDMDGLKVMKLTWDANQATKVKDVMDREQSSLNGAEAVKATPAYKAPVARYQAALTALDARLAGFSGEQAKDRQLQAELTSAERIEATKTAQVQAAARDLTAAQNRLKALDSKIGTPCDACGHPLDAHSLAHATKAARDAVEAAQRGAGAAVGALKAAQTASAECREALAAHRATMGDPSTLQTQAAQLRSAIEAHNSAMRQENDHMASARRWAEEVRRLQGETNPYEAMILRREEELVEVTKGQVEAEVRLREAEVEQETMTDVVKVFGPAGVRAHMLDQVTPFLNDRTAAYLDSMTDGSCKALWTTLVTDAKGNMKEQFCIEVTHPAGEGFAGLSGGEKRKVRIACAMALQDLVASRATKPFRLWVADEIDDALDASGLERLMTVLQDKARERGTVVVISHNDLKDWIPTTWTVVNEDGVASLETV